LVSRRKDRNRDTANLGGREPRRLRRRLPHGERAMDTSDVLSPVIAASIVFGLSRCAPLYEVTVPGMPEEVVMPSIEEQPLTINVPVGQQARFTVWATDRRPLRYQWKRYGVDIDGAVGPTLVLPTVSPRDEQAQFWAVVSNGIAAIASRHATLVVRPALCLTCELPEPRAASCAADAASSGVRNE